MKVLDSQRKTLKTPEQKRRYKALQLYQKGFVLPTDNQGIIFKVKSQKEGMYTVMLGESEYGCSCADYAYNAITQCKHIIAAVFARHDLGYQSKPLAKITGHDRMYCRVHKILYEKSDVCAECQIEMKTVKELGYDKLNYEL